jgi:hypothetical protein
MGRGNKRAIEHQILGHNDLIVCVSTVECRGNLLKEGGDLELDCIYVVLVI